MIVAGTLCNKMAPALRKVYDQCQNHATLFLWVLVLTVAGTIIILIQLSEGVIVLFQLMSMCPSVPSAEALLYGVLEPAENSR